MTTLNTLDMIKSAMKDIRQALDHIERYVQSLDGFICVTSTDISYQDLSELVDEHMTINSEFEYFEFKEALRELFKAFEIQEIEKDDNLCRMSSM